MRRLFFIAILLLPPKVYSQVYPSDGDTLNYRIISFSIPTNLPEDVFQVKIAEGDIHTIDSFNKHVFKSATGKGNRIIIEVPFFNTEYTWQCTYKNAKSILQTTKLYHFRTGALPVSVTTDSIRIRMVNVAKKYKSCYIFLDETRALYNMDGKPVWYLPETEVTKMQQIRDLKITSDGTITYEIDEHGAYETDYSGRILWQAPNNGAISEDNNEHYHHEFTKLSNGHYMALAQNFMFWKRPRPADSDLIFLPISLVKTEEINTTFEAAPMGTLIEYDRNGTIVWSWKSSDHFNGSNIFYREINAKPLQVHAHENSFYFNENEKTIYISCRNLNCIIKIKYPEGNVIKIYNGNNLFFGQHSCSIMQDGNLLLFNNNSTGRQSLPTILVLGESVVSDTLEKIWQYDLPVENRNGMPFASGGNALELPDRSIFISTGFPESRVLIVNRNKHVLLDAVVEKWDSINKIWDPGIFLYRASIITDKTLFEKLIQSTGKSQK